MTLTRKNKVILFVGRHSETQDRDWLPYGVLSLAAPLLQAGFAPVIIAEYADPDYEAIIREHAPDALLFGVSAYTEQIAASLRACRIFRNYAPDTPIAWGGHHARACPEQTVRHELVDLVFTGFAEQTLLQAVELLKAGKACRGIPGIIDKADPRPGLVAAPPDYAVTELPPYPWQLLQVGKYVQPDTRTLNYFTSRGCPGVCTTCPWCGDHPWQAFPLSRVVADVEQLVHDHQLRTVFFVDADMFYNKRHTLALAAAMRAKGIAVKWNGSGRVVDLARYSAADYDELASAGLAEIFVGIEQVTASMQKKIRKCFSLDAVEHMLQAVRSSGIRMRFSFICGLPGETLEDLQAMGACIERWRALNANVAFQGNQYRPYPGAWMYEQALAGGLTAPQDLEEWVAYPYFFASKLPGKDSFWQEVPWLSTRVNREYGNLFCKIFPRYDSTSFKKMPVVLPQAARQKS